jgi:hypothetical protein
MVEIPGFNPNEVPENDNNFELIPIGIYRAQIIDAKVEPTKSGTGDKLVLALEIVDGQYSNRRLWDNINIRNENPTAQKIGQRSLADICIQIGVNQSSVKTEDIEWKSLNIKVGIKQPTQKDKDNGYDKPKNVISYNVGIGDAIQNKAAPATQARPQATRPLTQAAGGAAKPWNTTRAKTAEDPPF